MCICRPALNEHGDHYVVWVASLFGDCVYTQREQASVIVALVSIACWVFSQLPQVCNNWRRGTCEGLSWMFLMNWLMGDTANLCGALLTRQLPTQIITALYFVIMDIVMICQYMTYPATPDSVDTPRPRSLPATPSTTPRPDSLNAANGRHVVQVVGLGLLCIIGVLQVPASDGSSPFLSSSSSSSSSSFSYSPSASSSSSSSSSFSSSPSNFAHPTGRVLLSLDEPNTNETVCGVDDNVEEWQRNVGTALGWYSMCVYLVSRIPQIFENIKNQSCKGLSVCMFIFAVCGNVTYSVSIYLRFDNWSLEDPKVPWLIGSCGTVFMDLFILVQFWYFRKGATRGYSPADFLSSTSGEDRSGDERAPILTKAAAMDGIEDDDDHHSD